MTTQELREKLVALQQSREDPDAELLLPLCGLIAAVLGPTSLGWDIASEAYRTLDQAGYPDHRHNPYRTAAEEWLDGQD